MNSDSSLTVSKYQTPSSSRQMKEATNGKGFSVENKAMGTKKFKQLGGHYYILLSNSFVLNLDLFTSTLLCFGEFIYFIYFVEVK